MLKFSKLLFKFLLLYTAIVNCSLMHGKMYASSNGCEMTELASIMNEIF